MVLYLDGVPLSMLAATGLLEFLQHHGGVRQQSAAFVSQGPLPVHGKVVHVVQGELAVVRLDAAAAALGSRQVPYRPLQLWRSIPAPAPQLTPQSSS